MGSGATSKRNSIPTRGSTTHFTDRTIKLFAYNLLLLPPNTRPNHSRNNYQRQNIPLKKDWQAHSLISHFGPQRRHCNVLNWPSPFIVSKDFLQCIYFWWWENIYPASDMLRWKKRDIISWNSFFLYAKGKPCSLYKINACFNFTPANACHEIHSGAVPFLEFLKIFTLDWWGDTASYAILFYI